MRVLMVGRIERTPFLLRIWGYRVRWARDGSTALALALKCPPHAILVDLGCAGLNGYELARQLRRGPTGPLLVAMVDSEQPDRGRIWGAGFTALHFSPAGPLGLHRVLERGWKHRP
jgi:DNA-binding response OmpR family regulator